MEKTLGERIRAARQRYGMSQAELARRIAISKTAMNQIELGTIDPRASRITAIAHVLGVSTDSLLLGREAEDAEYMPAGVVLVGAWSHAGSRCAQG